MNSTSPLDPPEDDPPASPWSAFEAAYRGVLSLDRLQRYRKLYDRFVETVGWIDPLVAGALVERERAAFVALLRDGPAPFVEWAGRRAA